MPSTTSGSSSSTARQPSSSSIIAALQRASFGIATLPSTSKTGEPLTDADIAKLIADEAREKEKIWREHGLGAYRSTCALSSASPSLRYARLADVPASQPAASRVISWPKAQH